MTNLQTRRPVAYRPPSPRNTQQALSDINAAIDRLAKGRPSITAGKLTTTNLAEEAGMSRKQLYHYFGTAPAVADRWHELATRRRAEPRVDTHKLKQELSDLQDALGAWQAVAAIARAQDRTPHRTSQSAARENQRLRAEVVASPVGNIVPLSYASSAER